MGDHATPERSEPQGDAGSLGTASVPTIGARSDYPQRPMSEERTESLMD